MSLMNYIKVIIALITKWRAAKVDSTFCTVAQLRTRQP